MLLATAILLHLGLSGHAGGAAAALLAVLQLLCAAALLAGSRKVGSRKVGLARQLAPLACCVVLPACLLLPGDSLVAAVLVSHTTLHAGLASLFGGSLRRGREPLVTAMARRMEPRLTDEMRAYTRSVTWLWALYGPAQIAVSLLLLAFAPLHAWSVFVNLLDLPLLLALFVGEYAYRRRRLPGRTRATLADTLRAAAAQARSA